MIKSEGSNGYLPTKRLETLVDGIFAIAMTLLVLGLAVPHINGQLSENVIQNAFYNILPSFYSFILSFFLLAIFWSGHHRIFNQIKRINSTLLWINVTWLLFIVMVPFSASAIGQYGSYALPSVIFNLNMMGIAFLLYLNLHYASQKGLLHEDVNTTRINFSKRFNTIFIFIALLAVILSFVIHSWSTMIYAVLFPIHILVKRK